MGPDVGPEPSGPSTPCSAFRAGGSPARSSSPKLGYGTCRAQCKAAGRHCTDRCDLRAQASGLVFFRGAEAEVFGGAFCSVGVFAKVSSAGATAERHASADVQVVTGRRLSANADGIRSGGRTNYQQGASGTTSRAHAKGGWHGARGSRQQLRPCNQSLAMYADMANSRRGVGQPQVAPRCPSSHPTFRRAGPSLCIGIRSGGSARIHPAPTPASDVNLKLAVHRSEFAQPKFLWSIGAVGFSNGYASTGASLCVKWVPSSDFPVPGRRPRIGAQGLQVGRGLSEVRGKATPGSAVEWPGMSDPQPELLALLPDPTPTTADPSRLARPPRRVPRL